MDDGTKKLRLIKVMYEVENPVFQSVDDIVKQYDQNHIVISDRKRDEKGRLIGGIVRLYGSDRDEMVKKSIDWQRSGEHSDAVFTTLMCKEWKELPWYYEEIDD